MVCSFPVAVKWLCTFMCRFCLLHCPDYFTEVTQKTKHQGLANERSRILDLMDKRHPKSKLKPPTSFIWFLLKLDTTIKLQFRLSENLANIYQKCNKCQWNDPLVCNHNPQLGKTGVVVSIGFLTWSVSVFWTLQSSWQYLNLGLHFNPL